MISPGFAYACRKKKTGANGTSPTKQKRIGERAAKASSDQNIRALEDQLEILDAQIAEIEVRQVVTPYMDDQRALTPKFRRKLN
ncbi:hypothetical protein ACVWZZ_002190 [Bradyrhizobium sp. LM6.10]